MSDNPRLIIELQDRSGASGAGSPNPNVPSGEGKSVTESQAEAFQRKLSEEGAAPKEQNATSPANDPIGTALDNQSRNIPSTPVPSGFSSNPVNSNPGAAAESLIRQLYQADPKVTGAEASKLSGLSAVDAQAIIDAIKAGFAGATPSVPVPPVPPVTPAPPIGATPPPNDPYGGLSATEIPRGAFQNIDPATGIPLPPQDTGNPGVTDPYGGLGNSYGNTGYRGVDIDPVTGRPYSSSGPTRPDDGYGDLGGGNRVPQSNAPNVTNSPQIDVITGKVIEEANKTSEVNGNQLHSAITRIIQSSPLGNTTLGSITQSVADLIPLVAPNGAGDIGTSLAGLAATATAGYAAYRAVRGVTEAGYNLYQAADNEAQRAVAFSRGLSPELAMAEAQAEIRQLRANFRTAGTLGNEAADYVTQSSKISTASQGIRDVLSEPVVQTLNKNLEAIAGLLEDLSTVMNEPGIKEGIQELVRSLLALDGIEGLSWIIENSIPPYIRQWLRKKAEEDNDTDLNSWFEDDFPHLEPPAPFNKVGNEQPLGADVAPIPGLKFN